MVRSCSYFESAPTPTLGGEINHQKTEIDITIVVIPKKLLFRYITTFSLCSNFIITKKVSKIGRFINLSDI